MFQIFLLWLAQFLVLFGCGELLVRFVLRRWWGRAALDLGVFHRFWIGTATVFVFLDFWYLILPVNALCWMFVVTAGLVGCALSLRDRHPADTSSAKWRLPLAAILFAVCAVSVAARIIACNGGDVPWDTNMYHLNLVRWINEYPAVPGLANLHYRFGMNSAFLRYAALWNNGFLHGKAAWVTPGFFELVAVAQWLGILVCRRGPLVARAFALLTMPFFLSAFGAISASLYYDTFSQTAILVLVMIALQTWASNATPSWEQTRGGCFVILCLAGLSFACKPIGAMSLLVAGSATLIVFFLFRRQEGARWILESVRCLGLPTLLVVGFIAINLIVSGWPAFPAPVARVPVDWALPTSMAELNYNLIKGYARMPTDDCVRAAKMDFWSWFPSWKSQFDTSSLKPVLLLSAFVFPAYLYSTFGRRWGHRRWLETALLTLAAANLAFWFIAAPGLRFGNGFFWCAMALLVAFWLNSQTERSPIVLGVSLLAAAALSTGAGWKPKSSSRLWKIPRAFPADTQEFEVPNGQTPKLVVRIPAGKSIETQALGDCALPSTPYQPTGQFQWREPGKLRNGFRIVPEASGTVSP